MIEFGKGYDVIAHGTDDVPRPNGRFYNSWPDGSFEPLWVVDVTMDFGLQGRKVQSRSTRDHYAHNSIPPTVMVQCVAPQFAYGRLLESIRISQRDLNTSYLKIDGGGITHMGNHHKGTHRSISAEGYVQNAPRRHAKHEYVVEFSIGFVVAKMHSPFADTQVKQRVLLSWHDIVHDILAHDKRTGFADDPDANPRPGVGQGDPVPDRPGLSPGPNGELRPN